MPLDFQRFNLQKEQNEIIIPFVLTSSVIFQRINNTLLSGALRKIVSNSELKPICSLSIFTDFQIYIQEVLLEQFEFVVEGDSGLLLNALGHLL